MYSITLLQVALLLEINLMTLQTLDKMKRIYHPMSILEEIYRAREVFF